MSSSRIKYNNKGFEASDGAIGVWLALLVKEIDTLQEKPEWLIKVRDEWNLQATAGFGCGVQARLDDLITSEENRERIVALSKRALTFFDGFKTTVPAPILNSYKTGGAGAHFTVDVPVANLARTGKYFIKLLEGTLKDVESDARFASTDARCQDARCQ